MDAFCQTFEAAIPGLRQEILTAFKTQVSQVGYRSVWEHFEEIINPILIAFFTNSPLLIARDQLKEATSKSVYPDLRIYYDDKIYAIDVKSGESTKNPWYDISRLDTYEETHLDKYAEEYSVVVRWSGRASLRVEQVYIEPTYRTVGYRAQSKGVLYRPYDGKLRPKAWADFEAEYSYWQDKAHFREGLIASRDYRRRSYSIEWYKAMNETQKQALKEDLARIDAGQPVVLDQLDERA